MSAQKFVLVHLSRWSFTDLKAHEESCDPYYSGELVPLVDYLRQNYPVISDDECRVHAGRISDYLEFEHWTNCIFKWRSRGLHGEGYDDYAIIAVLITGKASGVTTENVLPYLGLPQGIDPRAHTITTHTTN